MAANRLNPDDILRFSNNLLDFILDLIGEKAIGRSRRCAVSRIMFAAPETHIAAGKAAMERFAKFGFDIIISPSFDRSFKRLNQ